MKVRLLFLIGSFGTGGKERQLAEIIKNLPKENYDKFLLVKNDSGYYLDDIKQHLNGFANLCQHRVNFSSYIRLHQYIKYVKPDIIFSFATVFNYFFLLPTYLIGIRSPFINGGIRDASDNLQQHHKINNYILNTTKFVVANSYAGLKAYNQFGKDNRFVLYNGFDFKRIPTITKEQAIDKSEFDASKFNILMVSSLRRDEFKDPITFLKTAKEIQKFDNSIMFHIAGDGERKTELEAFIEDNKINNVKLLGNRSDVETLFLASDLSILTSRTEGISNSIMESMACGVPCIATSGGGTPEIIDNGKNGYILPFGDYKAIAEKIMYLKNNPEVLKELGYHAKKTIEEKFSIDIMIENFENIVNQVLK